MFSLMSPQITGTTDVLIENLRLISSLSKSLIVFPSATLPRRLVMLPCMPMPLPGWSYRNHRVPEPPRYEFCLLCTLSYDIPPILVSFVMPFEIFPLLKRNISCMGILYIKNLINFNYFIQFNNGSFWIFWKNELLLWQFTRGWYFLHFKS